MQVSHHRSNSVSTNEGQLLGPHDKSIDFFMDEIISACQLRLLGRLQSRHAPPSMKDKAPIIPKLYKNLSLLDRQPPSEIDSFCREQVLSMKRLFDALEDLEREDARSEAGRKLLRDILRHVKLLLLRIDSQSALVNNDNSGETTYKNLRKLNQYYSAARHLLRAARKFRAFHGLRIAEVSTGPFPESLSTGEGSVHEGLFTRSVNAVTLTPKAKRKNFVSMLETRARSNIQSISNTLQRSSNLKKRVHAEMKLLYHYECQKSQDHRPRVIVSNKHACYLCNLLLKVHGGFFIPSSHGNFYPAWRLPRFDEVKLPKEAKGRMLQCLVRFNSELEGKIKKCVAQPRQKLPDEQESIIFRSYTPTASSRMPTTTNTPKPSQKGTTLNIDSGIAQTQQNSKATLPLVVLPEPPHQINERSPTVVNIPIPPSPPQSSTSVLSPGAPRRKRAQSLAPSLQSSQRDRELCLRPNILTRGVPMTYTLSPGSLVEFHTPQIHLELSYDQVSSLNSFPPSLTSTRTPVPAIPSSDVDLVLHVEWLDPESWYPGRLSRAIDAGGRWATMRMADGILFEKDGLVFMEKDNVVCLKAVSSK